VHVGNEDIQAAVVIEVEYLDTHRAPRRLWKDRAALFHEALAADVFVVLIVTEHIQQEQIRPSVFVDVDDARVAGPGNIGQAGADGHVFEMVAAFVVVKNLFFRALRLEMT